MQGGTDKKISQFRMTHGDDSKENAQIWPKSSFSKEARLSQMQAFTIQAESESKARKRNELKHTKVAVEKIRELRSNSGNKEVPLFV